MSAATDFGLSSGDVDLASAHIALAAHLLGGVAGALCDAIDDADGPDDDTPHAAALLKLVDAARDAAHRAAQALDAGAYAGGPYTDNAGEVRESVHDALRAVLKARKP